MLNFAGKKRRTRKKDEPFGADPLGQQDYANILRLDKTLNHKYKGGSPLARRKGMAGKLETLMKNKFGKPALMTEDETEKKKEQKDLFLDEANIMDLDE